MKENVLIVLNEREANKKKRALELENKLKEKGVVSDRLLPSSRLEEVISERRISILVIDFILEGYGTALDLINSIKKNKEIYNPKIIIWTDEPSLSSATQALKMGAFDYIELYKSNSLDKVLLSIENIIEGKNGESSVCNNHHRLSKTLIGQSKEFLKAINLAKHFANNKSIITILGPEGSGKNSFAEFIHFLKKDSGLYKDEDYKYFQGELKELFCNYNNQDSFLIGKSTLFIDNIDFNPSELLSYISEEYLKKNQEELLIFGTTCKLTAKAWANLLNSETIILPSLKERSSDFIPLIEHFLKEIKHSYLKPKASRLSKDFIKIIAKLDWPHNIKELKSIIQESFSFSEESLSKLYSEYEIINEELNKLANSLSQKESLLLKCILDSKNRFEKLNQGTLDDYSSFDIFNALDKSSNNYRIAAAMLGTSVNNLRNYVNEKSKAN